jgi:TP901 family phage tail tape measure protein
MSVNVGTAVGYLDLDSSKFKSGLKAAQASLSEFTNSSNNTGIKFQALGGTLKSMGSILTQTVSTSLIAGGIAMGKFASDSEGSMAKVNSILQLNKKEFGSYKTTLETGAREIGMAYTDYADAAYNAISAGVEQANVTTFLAGANQLAKGGLTDLAKATDILTTVQNAYGLSQKDLSDVLIQTQNLGKVTVDELASSMGKIIPTANSLGVNIEQLGAGYAIMTSKGIASAEATTYMNSMFNELGKSGTKTDKILKEISGKSFKELSESGKSTGDILQMLDEYAKANNLSLTDLFGSAEAGKAALTLLSDGAEGFNDKLNLMKNSTDATTKAFEEMNDISGEKLKQGLNNLKNGLSDVGDALLPLIGSIGNVLSSFGQWLSKMAELNPVLTNIGVAIGVIVAAIGPLLMIVGNLITAFGVVSGFVTATLIPALTATGVTIGALTVPVWGVIAAITAFIAIGTLLYKNWDTIKAKCIEIWQNSIKPTIEKVTNTISAFLQATWTDIQAFLSTCWNLLSQLASMVWNAISSTISTAVNAISSVIKSVFNAITSFIQTVLNGWKNIIQTVWNAIQSVVSTYVNAVRSVIQSVFNAVSNIIGATSNGWKATLQSVWEGIKSIVSTGANAVKNVISTVWSGLKDLLTAPFIAAKSVIDGILSGISSAISSVSSAISSVKNAASSVIDKVNPFKKNIEISYSQEDINANARFRSNAIDLAKNLVYSDRTAKTSIAESISSVTKSASSMIKNKDVSSVKSGNSVVINNTYNSPKPASIRELKRQDEIQMRRLAMQLNF